MTVDVAAVLAASPWGGKAGLTWQPGVAAVASPMYQAAEWSSWIVTAENEPAALFLKILQPEMADLIDPVAAYAGARAAERAGIGPVVAFGVLDHQALALAYLPPPWRGARLSDLGTPAVLQSVIDAKRTFRQGPALPRVWDVFSRVRMLAARAEATATALPSDMPALLDQAWAIETAFIAAGRDSVPCHNDGQSSNIMLAPDGRVLLVDFDCAGQGDPHYDLAVLLNEVQDFEDGWRRGIEMQEGRCTGSVLNRCRAYAMADDLLWGLWGLILSHTSPRKELEFLKFGEWRLLRARMALRAPDFAARLHRL
ncbi:phosphotransferase family protein [Acidisoma cladoniae]|uniref:phosphotransferase family protein n=1 Tax=Acidisoma cladoniae TaxID=3040935 RepID=UPI0025502327|nr:aminoglycoside phosphotransferase family protein [Acidisoma sp. PAMC 29798]